MRNRTMWLAPVLMATLALVGMAFAAADDKKEGAAGEPGAKKGRKDGFRGGRGGRGVSVDQVVERLLSFDKDKDGKITKGELPERMQDLIAKGDLNKDGALDKDEIRKLASELTRDPRFSGFDGRGGGGRGFGPGDRRGAGGGFAPRSRGGERPPVGGIEQALVSLKLSANTKEAADKLVKAHRDNIPRLLDLARGDLLMKMKDVLSDEEYKNFKASVERQPGLGPVPIGRLGAPFGTAPVGASPGPPDVQRKLDQLQKELDDLRREIRR